jgi:hypothetical protein
VVNGANGFSNISSSNLDLAVLILSPNVSIGKRGTGTKDLDLVPRDARVRPFEAQRNRKAGWQRADRVGINSVAPAKAYEEWAASLIRLRAHLLCVSRDGNSLKAVHP